MSAAHIIAPGQMAGAEQVVLGGCAALHARGELHSLILIDELRAGSPAREMAARADALGIPVRIVTARARLDLAMLGQLAVAARGATLLHVHGAKALVYARAIASGRPIIATHHGDLARTGPERAYALLQRTLYGAIAAVCCVSEAQRRQLSRMNPYARYTLIENFARAQRPARPEPHAAPYWLVAGRLSEEKGLDILLSALAVARPATPVWIAGEGDRRECLEEQARGLGLDEAQVRFLGWRDDIPELIAGASAVLLPSRREGMPMVALEARVAGVPIVASMVGGVPEVVTHGDGGLLVPPEDVPALAQALRRLEAEGDALRAQAQASAPAAALRWAPATWADHTLSLYETLDAPR
jgi:glycosyltransferase involved in cell wall biosynthesis